ncbi:amino acid ABC transporter permease [Amycolatopsis mediterranei S699]|uniref:Permease component of ABC-type amino acid transport system n=2 Tax=Amycolatopsis mediterranei TaxID=33910 RepID=A0A0H3D1J8_AMYMU|nr:amino acid ABC transporter permease [Amycolatopsis mediterranei]ADJ44157.1 permease component of ABC-type amino acid transport system [Amycolatopsis mediterranei U32]AEK40892.1 amino acid ABC transporter permease [Amycolatopsis mediterranei S699]AFO75870.1 amino acid ABC transporter permease [Amycolatopsis mediterranei S699]AGT82999.1 amino acid ABC transporter permease [Amycolatopsis mediterranei RB]KDO06925.1 amino acid ABC transporter permease [Amycolatopsis mediterranei]
MDVLLNNLDLFGPFFLTTIELFVLSAVGALVWGTILAMLRVSPVPVFRAVGTAYVTIARNTPLTLVFAFFVFAYPLLDIVKLDYFPAAVVALTVYTSAFICEVVRSGINTVPVGQAEAGRALGLTFGQILGQVVLPQALRSVVPPLISTLIALLKNTTIAAGFSVAEAGAIRAYLSERGESQLVGLLWVALGFIILVAVLSFVQRSLEKRWSVAR